MSYVEIHLLKLDNYIKGVTGGTVTCGKLERLAVERFIRYKSKYIYKESELRKVLKFFSLLNYAPEKQFVLIDWQVFVIANLYALYKNEETRLFNFGYIEISKKNGKTSFNAALILYETLLDNDATTSNFILASSREQARIGLDFSKLIIENSPSISDLFTVNRNVIYNRSRGVYKKLEVRASEAAKFQGQKPDFVCVDEYAFHKDSELLYKAKSGMIASINPLLIAITTAANCPTTSPAYELRETCVNVLNEIVEDSNLFALIFSLDNKEEIENPKAWRKSNPSIGVTIKLESLISEYETAKNLSSKLDTFLTDNLNYWTSNIQETFIDDEIIIQLLTDEYQIPKGGDVYIGMDLSSNTDLCGISVLYFDAERDIYIVKNYHIFPNNAKKKIRAGGIDLTKWINEGYIIQQQTPTLDDNHIFELILQLSERYNIRSIGYDKWNASIIARRLEDKGLNLVAVSQTVGALSFPLRVMESYVLNKKFFMDRSPVTRYQWQNCRTYSDINKNRKLDKRKSESIDAIVSMNIAMHQHIEVNQSRFGKLLDSWAA